MTGEAASPGKPRVTLRQGIPRWKERPPTFASTTPWGAPSPPVLPGAGEGTASPTGDHRAGAQPREPGQASWGQERGAELGDQLQECPSPWRAVTRWPQPGYDLGREIPCWVLHQAPGPHGGTCAEVSFAHLQGQPLFLQTRSQAPRAGGRSRDLPFSGTAEIRPLRQGTFHGNLA